MARTPSRWGPQPAPGPPASDSGVCQSRWLGALPHNVRIRVTDTGLIADIKVCQGVQKERYFPLRWDRARECCQAVSAHPLLPLTISLYLQSKHYRLFYLFLRSQIAKAVYDRRKIIRSAICNRNTLRRYAYIMIYHWHRALADWVTFLDQLVIIASSYTRLSHFYKSPGPEPRVFKFSQRPLNSG